MPERREFTTVLLIEDDPGDARLVRELLGEVEDVAFRVEEAGNLAGGLERLEQGGIDAVLLDLGLPDSLGLDTLRAVLERYEDTPVVVLTGLEDRRAGIDAVGHGAQDRLLKMGLDSELLSRTLRYAVEQKRSAVALAERESRLSNILELAPNAIIVVEEDQRVSTFNRAAQEMFGYRSSEVLGQPLDTLLPERFVEVHRRHVRAFGEERVTARRMAGGGKEIYGRRRDGTEFPVECSIGKMDVPQGRCYLVICRDVTEERRRRAELERAQKLGAIGTFVSSFVHDVRNPLTGVLGFADLALQRDLDETTRQHLQTAREQAQRALDITQDLLAFAREESPRTDEQMSLNEIVRRVLRLRDHDLRSRRIQVHTDLQNGLPPVVGNRSRIEQVLLNLVMNAEQAMAEAHGKGTLSVATWQAAGSVHLTVGDDGPGIPEEHLQSVFDPFFTTKPREAGTGLGLSVCYGIVQEHGGNIQVASHAGQGTTFRVSLPAAPDLAAGALEYGQSS